jgi:hypothetical protein
LLLDVAAEFFEQADWPAERHQTDSMLRATFEGEHGPFTCYVLTDEDKEQLGFYAVLPSLVADEYRDAVAVFTSRLNYGLMIGNFELDYDSGEVRFRVGIDVEGSELSPPMVRSMAASACLNLDHHRSAIEAVGRGAISPADAYTAYEQSE